MSNDISFVIFILSIKYKSITESIHDYRLPDSSIYHWATIANTPLWTFSHLCWSCNSLDCAKEKLPFQNYQPLRSTWSCSSCFHMVFSHRASQKRLLRLTRYQLCRNIAHSINGRPQVVGTNKYRCLELWGLLLTHRFKSACWCRNQGSSRHHNERVC